MRRAIQDIREREQRLLHMLDERGNVPVSELSQAIGWAPSTMRKHLVHMEARKLIRRKHGMVYSMANLVSEDAIESQREQHLPEKHRIAVEASRMITPGLSLALGGGTTCRELALLLARASTDNIVITPSIDIAAILCENPQIVVHVPPGAVHHATHYIIGAGAKRFFEGFFVHTAFLGCDAISNQLRICTDNPAVAEIDRAIIQNAARFVALSDSSKLSKTALTTVAHAANIHTLITDRDAPPMLCLRLIQSGVEVRTI